MSEITAICTGCNKPASEIDEYLEASSDNGISVQQYIEEEEGTYNPENGHFLCTDCYIEAGMPSPPHPGRWIAP